LLLIADIDDPVSLLLLLLLLLLLRCLAGDWCAAAQVPVQDTAQGSHLQASWQAGLTACCLL
jgi:hypothetical protein